MFVCSNSEYEDGMEELAPVSVLDVVMALQRQGAIGQFKNSRYMLVTASICRYVLVRIAPPVLTKLAATYKQSALHCR